MRSGSLGSILAVFTFVGASGIAAAAQQPPNAGICDPLKGTPPRLGLHGLCKSYCENQDCNVDDPLSAQCAAPDPNVLAVYNSKKRTTDPAMPCVKAPCPCWGLDEINALNDQELEFCVSEERQDLLLLGYGATFAEDVLAVRVRGDLSSNEFTCRYIDERTSPDTVRVLIISEEEFASCREQVEERGELRACFVRPTFSDEDWTAKEQLEYVIAELQKIIDSQPQESVSDKVEDALEKAQVAEEELSKSPPDNQAAVGTIEGAVGDLESAVADGLDIGRGTELMYKLAEVARLLAVSALEEAMSQGGDPVAIADAQVSLDAGRALQADAKFKDAVNRYKDALAKAESALP